jgi:hypothetical protein
MDKFPYQDKQMATLQAFDCLQAGEHEAGHTYFSGSNRLRQRQFQKPGSSQADKQMLRACSMVRGLFLLGAKKTLAIIRSPSTYWHADFSNKSPALRNSD